MRGRAIRLSLPRRLVIDLLHFGAAIPTVPVQRRMAIAPVVAARATCRQKPRWTAIFAKAYALTAREFPALRRVYVKIPWPHLYEYAESHAYIVVERDYEGEPCLFSTVIEDTATRSFKEIGNALKRAWTAPIETIGEFGLELKLARFPRPLRRLLMWLVLNVGAWRANFYGTFGLSVYSALEAESLHPIMPMTGSLNYGLIAEDGSVTVRIIYDHRVLDGATVARALARLEQILNTAILEELKSLPQARAGNAATPRRASG
jgi:pyruvate/2-oxoglutarate dehydrogenase complex dihydrolipoamide acyltransferase (E2) component